MDIKKICILFGILILSSSINLTYGEVLCGDEGTHLDENNKCVADFYALENFWLAIGVVVAAVGVTVAAVVTVLDRKRDIRRRTQDLIREYSEDFRKISEQERNLKTKLDCSLYCEQYLDTLEMIATLSRTVDLKKEVSDFFENNFVYGIHLWRWYMEKVAKFKEEHLDELWDLPFLENYHYQTDEKTKNYLENERWRDFRQFCHKPPQKTKFHLELPKWQEEGLSEESKYRVLPDIMDTTDFDDIPEEDGLTKGELIQLIKDFGTNIDNLADDERNLKKDIDCSVYAEKYLDILEQIASLYKKQVIPKRAADYFENKFAYGINLWYWYFIKVLNLDPQEFWDRPTEITEKFLSDDEKKYFQNERWREFRWWCKKNQIQQFEENMDDPIILPNRMWQYGKNKNNESEVF